MPARRDAARARSAADPRTAASSVSGTVRPISAAVRCSPAAVFVLAAAMTRTEGWRRWAWPARWAGIVFAVLLVVLTVAQESGVVGLLERLLAGLGAAAIAALAFGIARRPTGT